MRLFEKKTDKIEKGVAEYFEMMKAYTPAFRTFEGSVYEMELTRAAIHSFATHVSKLEPRVKGSGNAQLERTLRFKPNPLMDTKKYLYRLATVYMVDNTAFIAPLEDKYGNIIGYYALATEKCRVVDYKGKKYLQYELEQGNLFAVELEKTGIMNQFQYNNELFGESNQCLRPTMELINTNNQGIVEGVKSSAAIRFLAKLAGQFKPQVIEEERKRFTENNLSAKNNGGVLMFDQKYEEVKQIMSQPFTVDSAQMKVIKENVFQYFGTNENILMNKFSSSEWNAYYEGKIEPFAIELSLVHTNMTFNMHEIAYGNQIIFTSNRLQHMSAAEKVQLVATLFDRGFISLNDGREIFNLAPVDGGDKRYIRKEYVSADNIDQILKMEVTDNAGNEEQRIQNDSTIPAEGSGEEN